MLPVELHEPLLWPADTFEGRLDEAASGWQGTVADNVPLLTERDDVGGVLVP